MHQCEKCGRYFGPSGLAQGEKVLLCPQPRLWVGVPEIFSCGLADCVAPVVVPGPVVSNVKDCLQVQKAKENGKTGKKKHRTSNIEHRTSKWGVDRSCPRDTEPLEIAPPALGSSGASNLQETVSHSQQVREFERSATAKDQNEVMFQVLVKCFGKWVSNGELNGLGIGRPNSRAAQLREDPRVVEQGWDVDSGMIDNPTGNGKQWWAYRLCKKGESMRLKREEDRGEQERLNFERDSQ